MQNSTIAIFQHRFQQTLTTIIFSMELRENYPFNILQGHGVTPDIHLASFVMNILTVVYYQTIKIFLLKCILEYLIFKV